MKTIITAVLAALLASAGTAIAVDNARIFPGGIDSVTTATDRTNTGIRGSEIDKGTLKVTNRRPADSQGVPMANGNASGVSIALEGVGGTGPTQAQGIFLNAPQGTSGKLLNLRNAGVEILTLAPDPAAPGRYVLQLKGRVVQVP